MPITPRISYNKESLYYKTPIVKRFLTYYVHRPIRPNELDESYIIDDNNYVFRPDNLAADTYGNEDLFWVIPIRNGFQDLYFDLTYGKRIIIPHPSYIEGII